MHVVLSYLNSGCGVGGQEITLANNNKAIMYMKLILYLYVSDQWFIYIYIYTYLYICIYAYI